MTPVRRISVVVPMRDEAASVQDLVRDLAVQDFDGALEVFVADGGSSDGSVELVQRAAAEAGLPLEVLENPARTVSAGLNACIARAGGDLVVRMDCHTRYPPDYLSGCARAAEETGAWNVGGLLLPEGRTPVEQAVACAMNSPFGGIVWTRHAASREPVEVDTVPYGAFRPEALARVGPFDESLVRNQDDEYNLRLRLAGGTIVLDPRIRLHYRPRGSFRSLARQYFQYGFWKVAVMRKHRQVLSARSLVPLVLVGSLIVLAPLSVWLPPARWALAAELALYAVCALGFAALALRRRRRRLLPLVAGVFPVFHVSYGVGMAWGLVRTVRR